MNICMRHGAVSTLTCFYMFLRHVFPLQEYAERLEEHGYSDLDDLLSAEHRDLEEMLRHIEAKPGQPLGHWGFLTMKIDED